MPNGIHSEMLQVRACFLMLIAQKEKHEISLRQRARRDVDGCKYGWLRHQRCPGENAVGHFARLLGDVFARSVCLRVSNPNCLAGRGPAAHCCANGLQTDHLAHL